MKGISDVLDVYEDMVTIRSVGVMGFLYKGLNGSRSINYSSISSIQFKEAGNTLSGYIQFTIPEGNIRKPGLWSAAKGDENSFMFGNFGNSNELAANIVSYITSSISNLGKPKISTQTTSVADEIMKLASLKEQGLLSDDEFQLAKKKLLG